MQSEMSSCVEVALMEVFHNLRSRPVRKNPDQFTLPESHVVEDIPVTTVTSSERNIMRSTNTSEETVLRKIHFSVLKAMDNRNGVTTVNACDSNAYFGERTPEQDEDASWLPSEDKEEEVNRGKKAAKARKRTIRNPKSYPDAVVKVLQDWYRTHTSETCCKEERKRLAAATGLSEKQVSEYMITLRKRQKGKQYLCLLTNTPTLKQRILYRAGVGQPPNT